jgi:hypothetical protein
MKIPFSLFPASWGLRGKSRKIAEAEYYFEGYDLDKALARINADNNDDYELNLINIELKHKRIDEYAADNRRIDVNNRINGNDEKALLLARLDLDLKYNKISQQEHERKTADLKGEPYMAMPKISWDPIDPSKTYFELDYNEYFIKYLEANGYQGTEESIINHWLNDVCNSVLDEMASNEPEFVRTIRTVRRNDGKTEHS